MRSLIPAFVFSLLLMDSGVLGQEPRCDIELLRRGSMWLVSIRSHETSAREILSRLARDLGARFEVDGGVLEIIDSAKPPVAVQNMPVPEFVRHLAGALDLEGVIDGPAVLVKPLPASDNDAREWLRGHALRTWKQVAASGNAEEGAEALYETALLHLGGEEWAQAVAAFRIFVAAHPRDLKTPQARLLAGWSAFRQGAFADSAALIRELEDRHESGSEVDEGQLLLARVYMKMGSFADALLRLDRTINNISGRLRALAMLQRAELHYVAGNGQAAVDALSVFDLDVQRQQRDLALHVPFYEGLCLQKAGQWRGALPHLQLAVLQESDEEFRVRAALRLVHSYLNEKDIVSALFANRLVQGIRPAGRHQIEHFSLQGEILDRLGLVDMAIPAYQRVIVDLEEKGVPSESVVERLGDVLFKDHRFAEAREMFSALADRPSLEGMALYMVARCDVSVGDYERALSVLARASAAQPPASREQVAKLRGLCYLKLEKYELASQAFEGEKEKR